MKKIILIALFAIVIVGFLFADERANSARGYVTQWQAGPMEGIGIGIYVDTPQYGWMEVEWDYTNENGYYNLCFEYAGAGTEFRITAYLPNGPSHYYHTYSGSGDIWHNFTYHPSSGGD